MSWDWEFNKIDERVITANDAYLQQLQESHAELLRVLTLILISPDCRVATFRDAAVAAISRAEKLK